MSIGAWSDKAKAARDRRLLARMELPGIYADRLSMSQGLGRTNERPSTSNGSLVSMGWETGSAYRSSPRITVKVLNLVRSGGVEGTVLRTFRHEVAI